MCYIIFDMFIYIYIYICIYITLLPAPLRQSRARLTDGAEQQAKGP